jgi:hypothetical protein
MSNNQLARVDRREVARQDVRVLTGGADQSWEVMFRQADALVRSGFLPNSIKTPEQAIAIILTGEELDIPKMLALRSIHIINGTPTLSADLMASLVQRAIDRKGDGELRVQPPTPEKCTVIYRRWGWSEAQQYTYTIEDARKAGLAGKGTWAAHPASMLRARATAHVCRMGWPDVIAGLYAPEELADSTPNLGTPSPDEAKWSTPTIGETDDDEEKPQPPQPVQAVESEVVDADTGEIQTKESLGQNIKALRERLGWDETAVRVEARSVGASLNTIDGLRQMVTLLAHYVDKAEAEAEPQPDVEPEQASMIVDADVVNRNATWA